MGTRENYLCFIVATTLYALGQIICSSVHSRTIWTIWSERVGRVRLVGIVIGLDAIQKSFVVGLGIIIQSLIQKKFVVFENSEKVDCLKKRQPQYLVFLRQRLLILTPKRSGNTYN